MLKINILSLTADPQPLSLTLSADALGLGAEVRWNAPVTLQGAIHRLGEKIYFKGRVDTTARLACSRCLNEIETPVTAELLLLGIPAAEMREFAASFEGGAGGLDPSLVPYTGEQWDLTEDIRSAVLLAVPVKPLCREDCPGLCPSCGAPLAERGCRCGEQDRPGPFSALKQWRSSSGE